ncbi:MAG: hypothetical protein JJT96_00660 [Opitutales bacterium]|nr:hypothetical protein [Opitutales bacterium]
MQSFLPRLSLFALVALLTLPMGALAADLPDRVSEYARANLVLTVRAAPALDSAGQMREIVRRTAIHREWQVIGDHPGENLLVLNLVHRRSDSTLYLVYDEETVRFYSDSWQLDRQGNRRGRAEPTGWLRNLDRDLTRNIALAAE